jgi:uncharacterized membrane protein
MSHPKPAGIGKREDISLDSAAGHLLEECRMVLPGVQALFGFQLIAVFNDGFSEKLAHPEQLLHLAAIVLTALAMALVMTPAALHRQAEPRAVSERYLWLASGMVLAGMVPLAVAVGLDAYIVSRIIVGNTAFGVVVGAVLIAIFAWLWIVLPRHERRLRP